MLEEEFMLLKHYGIPQAIVPTAKGLGTQILTKYYTIYSYVF